MCRRLMPPFPLVGALAAALLVTLVVSSLSSERAAASHVSDAGYEGTTNNGWLLSFLVTPDGTAVDAFDMDMFECDRPISAVFPLTAIDGTQAGHPFAGSTSGGSAGYSWDLTISGSFSPGGAASGTWDLDALILFIPCSASGTWTATTPDSDGDGCFDAQELGTNEQLGGLRDPNNPYDFYDTNGDGTVDLLNDVFNVAGVFGADADGVGPGEPDGYDAALDRSAPAMGMDPWDMQAPDGMIDLLTDIFGVAKQFGHSCA